MKSLQFLKIYKRFDMKRKKFAHAAVNEKGKTEKSCALFYNWLFYKAL